MIKRALLAITAVAALAGPAHAADHIKLGYMVSLSGVFAIVGSEQQRGLQLALEELDNKLGGVPVTLYTVDDKGSPPEAIQVASKLVDQEKVDIVTGMMNSATTIATMKQYEDAGTFIISALAGPLQYAGKECHQNAFFVSFANDEWDTALGKYMSEHGVKSTYMMGADYQAGWEKLAGAKRTFKGQVFGPVFTPVNQLDFSAELAQVRAANPDSMFVFYPGALGIAFLKQYAQAGLKAKIYSEDTMASELSFPAEGASALGVIQSTSWNAELDNAQNKKFVAAFIKKYGRRPAIFAALQYDAIMLLNAAVSQVKGKIEDKDALRAALRKADFASIRGPFRFNNNHFPIQNIYITEVEKDGQGGMKLALKGTAATDWQDDYHQDCPMK
ncbi:MAG TPA: ABC transporter substrate-binding protein [Alphaproteobacteria bacterium]|nr:ABC transporter substrate-binding protein [Alphaproteobacteria bacterium]